MKTKHQANGNCCFFAGLLGVVILLCFLFIIGIPKFVIALEYWDSCPLSPLIPLYMCVTGLLGVLCVGHSAFLWSCLYRRHMKKKASHDCCLVLWCCIMLTVPVAQLTGAPYIIYTYHTSFNTSECDVIHHKLTSPISNQSASSVDVSAIQSLNATQPSYSLNSGSQRQDSQDCHYCANVLITCAYVTSVFELIFMTLPIFCLIIATVVFRIRNKELSR